MAYDEGLAATLREQLIDHEPIEKRMFGGLCFMVRGHMLCGVSGERTMVRVGKDRHDEAMNRLGAAPMDFTGRPMRGFAYVEPEVCGEDGVDQFLELALQFNRELPAR